MMGGMSLALPSDGPSREQALSVLREVLLDPDIPAETRRKAALDVLAYKDKTAQFESHVTEAQLEIVGRVIGELEEIRESLDDGKGALGTLTEPGKDRSLLPV